MEFLIAEIKDLASMMRQWHLGSNQQKRAIINDLLTDQLSDSLSKLADLSKATLQTCIENIGRNSAVDYNGPIEAQAERLTDIAKQIISLDQDIEAYNRHFMTEGIND
jgi:hypothetical protein